MSAATRRRALGSLAAAGANVAVSPGAAAEDPVQVVLAEHGEIGELLVRGPSAGEGYWNQRAKSRRTFAGEWTYTGDKYVCDQDGYY